MARNREFDINEALTSAMGLFWLNGYSNTSIDTLLDSMNIGKGSFYQAFDNKRDLYLQTLELYKNQSRYFFEEISSNGKGINRLKNYFISLIDEMYKEDFVQRGCFLCNASIENSGKDNEITEIVSSGYKEVIDKLQEIVEESQTIGEIRKDLKPEDTAHWLFSSSYGLLMLAKSDFKKDKIKKIAMDTINILV
jgi:TetR/AcrR family transcriptional repressor of nem operon